MKLLFLFFVSLVHFQTSANSKQVYFNIQLENASLKEVFNLITEQSDYSFVYSDIDIHEFQNVNLNVKEASIDRVLQSCLKGLDLEYEIHNNVIILRKVKAPKKLKKEESDESSSDEDADQGVPVSGKITDKDGIPLPGASILEKGTSNGCITDANGDFSLNVEGSNSVLQISFIGFEMQEVAVGEQSTINFVLETSLTGIEEVAVVGYGTQKKERIGSAVSQIEATQIEKIAVGACNVEQMLGGQIKGVQISQSSGEPTSAATFRIRGITSPFSSGNNQPLFVVDGVPFNTDAQFDAGSPGADQFQNPLLSIDPKEIQSLTVLKDAGATAIYGSRGANGVILITTKRGRKNSQIRSTLDYSIGFSNPVRKQEVLDAEGFKELHLMMARNTLEAYKTGAASRMGYNTAIQIIDPITGEPRETVMDIATRTQMPLFGEGNTDWQDMVYQKNAPTHQWNLNMSGGNAHTNFFTGISYTDQQPLAINSSFKRYGARLGIDSEVNNWLKVGSTLNYSGYRNEGAMPNITLYSTRPDITVRNEDDDTFTRFPLWTGMMLGMVLSLASFANPVATLDGETTTNATSFMGNMYAEAKLFTGFSVRADINTGVFNTRSRMFMPLRSAPIFGSSGESTLISNAGDNVNTSLNLRGDYHVILDEKHSIDLMAGTSWDKNTYYRYSGRSTGFSDDYVLTNAVAAANNQITADGEAQNGLNSIFSRVQYSYNGRYAATFNFRTDKSSKFGPGNQRAYFPSVALNWNIARERFMDNADFINKLILRGSYGKSGSSNIADFVYLQFFTAGSGIYNEYEPGKPTIIPDETYPNIDIQWETTKEFNLGLDFSLFNNFLFGSIDVYDKYTDGILIASPYPLESGASEYTSNLAEISNKGWELEASANLIRRKDMHWLVGFNISSNHNKVENMEGHHLTGFQSNYYTVGEPVGVIKGYRVEKIIQEQSEIDALNENSPTGIYYQATTAPGDYLYKDLDGDKRITAEDQEVIGDLQPDFFGGFSTTFAYKGLSLNAGFQFSVGNEQRWAGWSLIDVTSPIYNGSPEALNDTWTEDRKDANYTRLIYGNSYNSSLNDAILQDASYLKFKVLRLNYELPRNIMSKTPVSRASVYVSALNLYTWTKFKGIDPESGGSSITSGLTNSSVYPYAKTISAGIKLEF